MGNNINRRRVGGGKDYGNEGLSYAVSYVTGELLLSRNSFKNYWIANVHSDAEVCEDFGVAVVNDHIYWSNRTGLYKSTDDGKTFQTLHTYRSVSNGNNSTTFLIAVSPDESYIGVFIYMYSGSSIVYSNNSGKSFTEKTNVYRGLFSSDTLGGANCYPFKWFYITNNNTIACVNFETNSVSARVSAKGYVCVQPHLYLPQISGLGYRHYYSNLYSLFYLMNSTNIAGNWSSSITSTFGSSSSLVMAIDGTPNGDYMVAIDYNEYKIANSDTGFEYKGTLWSKTLKDYFNEAGIAFNTSPWYTILLLISKDKKYTYIHTSGVYLTIKNDTKELVSCRLFSESDPFYKLIALHICKYDRPEN